MLKSFIKVLFAFGGLVVATVGMFSFSALLEASVIYLICNYLLSHVFPHYLRFYDALYLGLAIVSYRFWWNLRTTVIHKKDSE